MIEVKNTDVTPKISKLFDIFRQSIIHEVTFQMVSWKVAL